MLVVGGLASCLELMVVGLWMAVGRVATTAGCGRRELRMVVDRVATSVDRGRRGRLMVGHRNSLVGRRRMVAVMVGSGRMGSRALACLGLMERMRLVAGTVVGLLESQQSSGSLVAVAVADTG